MIDATIVRAHTCSGGIRQKHTDIQALRRSKGGFTTKIHALMVGLGNPLKFILTPGQRHEITQAPALMQDMENTGVIADKGYDSNTFVQNLEEKGCRPLFLPKETENIPDIMMNISIRNDTSSNVSLAKSNILEESSQDLIKRLLLFWPSCILSLYSYDCDNFVHTI